MCAPTAGCRFGAEQWGPFRGRMVDAETGAPIPGAHFMVSWERDYPNPVHWTQRFYDAQEAVTDVTLSGGCDLSNPINGLGGAAVVVRVYLTAGSTCIFHITDTNLGKGGLPKPPPRR